MKKLFDRIGWEARVIIVCMFIGGMVGLLVGATKPPEANLNDQRTWKASGSNSIAFGRPQTYPGSPQTLAAVTNKVPKMELRERSEVLTNWTDSSSARTMMWCGYEDLCNHTTITQIGVVVSNIVATLTDGSGRTFTATQQIVLTNLTRTFVRQLIKRFPDGSMEVERTL